MSGAPANITSGLLGSYSPSLSGTYAPVDFGGAEDTQPPAIALDPTGNGNLQPYTTLVSNVLSRQTLEIKERAAIPQTINQKWRYKMREFFFQRNDELLSTLKRPIANHPYLSQTENFIRKFGRSDFSPTHNSLHNTFLDGSGVSMLPQIENELKNIGPASPAQLAEEIKWLYESYKEAGDAIYKYESQLKEKVDSLDAVYKKVVTFMDLPDEPESAEISELIQKYAHRKFNDNNIQESYDTLIAAYRRFASLREIVGCLRSMENVDKEPLCSICLNEPVSFALSPCGHTFCGTCSKRQISQCYMCRNLVKDKVRLYFG